MRQRRGSKWMVAATVAVASLALAPLAASAQVLFYQQQGGFTGGTAQDEGAGLGGVEFFGPTGFSPTSGPNAGAQTYEQIGWGCGSAAASTGRNTLCAAPTNTVVTTSPVTGTPPFLGQPADFPVDYRSALDVDVFTGTVTVNGDWEDISSLQHYNRTISSDSNSLTQIDIDSLLTLDTIPPSTSDSDAGFVRLRFEETLNSADPCPGGGGNPCADVFTFDIVVLDPVLVTVGGVQYQLEFRLIFPDQTIDERTGLPFANGAQPCIAEGNICTNENAISEVIVQFRVLSVDVPVPAPAPLLLLGLGLGGLGVAGWLRRR